MRSSRAPARSAARTSAHFQSLLRSAATTSAALAPTLKVSRTSAQSTGRCMMSSMSIAYCCVVIIRGLHAVAVLRGNCGLLVTKPAWACRDG